MFSTYIYLDTHLFIWITIARFFISMSSFGTTRKLLCFYFWVLRLNQFHL